MATFRKRLSRYFLSSPNQSSHTTISTQYDILSGFYEDVHYVPAQIIHPENTRAALSNIVGYEVLDLACGTSFYSNLLID